MLRRPRPRPRGLSSPRVARPTNSLRPAQQKKSLTNNFLQVSDLFNKLFFRNFNSKKKLYHHFISHLPLL